jgi:hypothetical protein
VTGVVLDLLLEIIVGDHLDYLRHCIKQAVEVAPTNSREVGNTSDRHHYQYPKQRFHQKGFR